MTKFKTPVASSEVEMPICCAPTRGVLTSLDTNGNGDSRTDWTRAEIAELFDLPFDELMWGAQGVHRRHHARGEVQLCTLLSIKTGGCVEDCGYCSQSKSADSGLKATKLMDDRQSVV